MAKFSDLDSERQIHLIIILRSLQMAVDQLATRAGVNPLPIRFQLLLKAESDVDDLSESEIAELVRKLDAEADAELD